MQFAMFAIFISSCDKVELPDPILDDPVFVVAGMVDGEAFDFQAGVDEYYLFTQVTEDINGFLVYEGTLKDIDDCENPCPNSLSIEFRKDTIPGANIEDLLNVGLKEIWNKDLSTTGNMAAVTFENLSTASPGSTFEWNFGNNITSMLEDPGTVVFDSLVPNSNPIISLKVSSASGNCSSIYSNPIITPSTECMVSISLESIPAGQELCANMMGVAPFSYNWQDASGFGQTSECISVPSDTLGSIFLISTDASGCSDSMSLDFFGDLGQPTEFCTARFRISDYVTIVAEDDLGFGKVNIIYVDENGVSYESNSAELNPLDNFTILSAESYDDNENGKATYKFTFECDVDLANDLGEKIRMENVVGTWAVAVE